MAAPVALGRHPGLQRGGGAARALRAPLSRARRARAAPTRSIFVNDGSRDRSAAMLREQFQKRPDVTRVILFNGNFGQHMAIMAGFEHVPRRAHRHARRRPAEPARGDRQAPREDGRGPRLRGLDPPQAPGRGVAALGLEGDEPAARAHHPHPDDRPGLHAARLRPARSSTRSTPRAR